MVNWNPYGDTVYHGSPEDDLEELEWRSPPYEGGFGGGVYVDYDIETSHTYGNNTYALRLLLHDDEIFELEYNTIPAFDGESILVGESVPPFQFELYNKGSSRVDAKLYTVSDRDVAGIFAGQVLEDLLTEMITDRRVPDTLPPFPTTHNPKQMKFGFAPRHDLRSLSPPAVAFLKIFLDELYDDDRLNAFDEAVPEAPTCVEDVVEAVEEAIENEDLMRLPYVHDENDLWVWVEAVIDYAEEESTARVGTEIDLDDIGAEVEAAGWKALYVPDLRPLSEMLVFNANDLEMVGLVESRDDHRW